MRTKSISRIAAGLRSLKSTTLLSISSAVIVAGCATATAIAPSQSHVDRVQDKFPGYTLADLHRGKSLYETHCKSCHALKDPASKTEAEWNTIVPAMVQKVNRNSMVLGAQAQEDIRRYVITMGPAANQTN